MSAISSAQATSSAPKLPLTFEFTKRKRWADLLITELVDAVILILNPCCKVLYCGTAVTELLGWRDVDLVDCDLNDFIHPEDRANFRTGFNESMRTNVEMLSYIRLKSQNGPASYPSTTQSKDVLFEIKGYPHLLEEEPESPKCFFAVAKPYPSKNTAMLNTFLELKTENERLQQRLAELKSRGSAPAASLVQSPASSQLNPVYATSSMQPPRILPAVTSSQRLLDSTGFYTNSSLSSGMYEETLGGPSMSTFEGNVYGTGTFYSANPEDDPEDASKKKKIKKAHTVEQYVCITCGRTDSPEWRKGPLGPKTLCNACGLRWAKQVRKTDDNAEANSSAGGEGAT